jgi:predicted acyl esterase
MIVERDVAVQMSDGITLHVNVFRPDVVAPVVMSMTPTVKTRRPTASACSRCGPPGSDSDTSIAHA